MSEQYEHTVEVYELRLDHPSEPLGALLRRFVVNAPDTKVALHSGVDATKASPPAEHYFVVVFQGGLSTRIAKPAGWVGTYTVEQWSQIRDAVGGLDAVMKLVANHCRAAKGLPERTYH
jgi:hypothetical protein